MKAKTFFRLAIVAIAMTSTCLSQGSAYPNSTPTRNTKKKVLVVQPQSAETFVAITQYHVQESVAAEFRKALDNYAQNAMADENNIMAEAFQEREHPSILWLIERWSDKNNLDEFKKSPAFTTLQSLSKTALVAPVKTYLLSDLEPMAKDEWRKAPAKEDDPIVIMLFVESKAGTEENFKDIYHTAMPKFRGEPGVITYQLSQSKNDRTQFVTYEKFRNEEAFQYHLKFPPIQPVIDYLNTSIKKQPFQTGLHRLVPLNTAGKK